MPIRRFIEVYRDHPADQLPEDVAAALTPPEREAFADVPAAFARLAGRCNVHSLRRLLEVCAAAQFASMQMNAYEHAPLRAYFRFILSESSPAVRLPEQSADLSAFPDPLRDVYSSVGGIQDDDFAYAGSLWTPTAVRPMTDSMGWLAEEQAIPPSECFMFLRSFGGDQYGYHAGTGRAVQYDHEDGLMTDLGALSNLLDLYFNGLAEGTRL